MPDPVFTMNFLGNAHRCASEMMSNAVYIRQELVNVALPPEWKEPIEDLCEDLIGTKHDVISEVHELAEILAEDSADRRIPGRIDRICKWLDEPILTMHGIVEKLKQYAEGDKRYSLACLLIAESATHILNTRNAMPSFAGKASSQPAQDQANHE